MTTKAISSSLDGFRAVPVEVECDSSNSLPAVIIVGMANKSIDEAKERLRSAITNSGLQMPRKRITLNLSPADLPKNGTNFDLPMALAILLKTEQIPTKSLADTSVVGELGLDGSIKPVSGILAHITCAKDQGKSKVIIPSANSEQASLIGGIEIIPFDNLAQLISHLMEEVLVRSLQPAAIESRFKTKLDLSDIKGQERAKRALIIAASGGHNILFSGPPGAGKTMLAKALTTILPPLSQEQMIDVTLLHSLQGRNSKRPITSPPFRSPHHSASHIALVGGGQSPKPGEISLAHHGVLFLDEMPEFPRASLEALRQPLEDGEVTISRAQSSSVYPANFMLVGTNNPCPCGYLGDRRAACTCSMNQVINYQKRLSGPLVDRIDMVVQLPPVSLDKILKKSKEKTSPLVAQKVKETRDYQLKTRKKLNSNLTSNDIKEELWITHAVKDLLDKASDKLQLTARGYIKTIKVAQTIADYENAEEITPQHVAEALQYRQINRVKIIS